MGVIMNKDIVNDNFNFMKLMYGLLSIKQVVGERIMCIRIISN